MSGLANLNTSQRLFSEMLDEPSTENGAAGEKFRLILKENTRIPGKQATDIYQNNTIGTRKRALRAIYPVIEKILGDQCFDSIAYDYVISAPSVDSDLNAYGEKLPDFLQNIVDQYESFSAYPYLSDLARLEWIFHKTYYAPDDAQEPVSSTLVADLPSDIEESVGLKKSCSLECFTTPYPVLDIWQCHQGNEVESEVAELEVDDYLIIYRLNGHPVIERIDRGDRCIMQNVADQCSLDHLVRVAVEQGIDIEQRLPAMIEKGWLRMIRSV